MDRGGPRWTGGGPWWARLDPRLEPDRWSPVQPAPCRKCCGGGDSLLWQLATVHRDHPTSTADDVPMHVRLAGLAGVIYRSGRPRCDTGSSPLFSRAGVVVVAHRRRDRHRPNWGRKLGWNYLPVLRTLPHGGRSSMSRRPRSTCPHRDDRVSSRPRKPTGRQAGTCTR